MANTKSFNKATNVITQLCSTLWDRIDSSLAVSSVHGIFQARILQWVAIPFSRRFPDPEIEPGSPALQADCLPSEQGVETNEGL